MVSRWAEGILDMCPSTGRAKSRTYESKAQYAELPRGQVGVDIMSLQLHDH
jgi:hypothetical protein